MPTADVLQDHNAQAQCAVTSPHDAAILALRGLLSLLDVRRIITVEFGLSDVVQLGCACFPAVTVVAIKVLACCSALVGARASLAECAL